MIKIYHFPLTLIEDVFETRSDGGTLCDFVRNNIEKYHHVADVDTDELEVSYRLTNTEHGKWWTDNLVTFHGSLEYGMQGARITSVGDVLDMNAIRFVVAPHGFLYL